MGYTFSAGFSLNVIGEIVNTLCRIKNDTARGLAFDFLIAFLRKRNIKIYGFTEKHIELFHELRDLDNRVDTSNLLALTVAIDEHAGVFITFNRDILESEKLNSRSFRRKYGVKIKQPIKFS